MFSLDSVRSCIHAPILRNWFLLLISPWKREVFSGSCITFVHAFYYELLRRAWETKLFYIQISSLPPSTRSTSPHVQKSCYTRFLFLISAWKRSESVGGWEKKIFSRSWLCECAFIQMQCCGCVALQWTDEILCITRWSCFYFVATQLAEFSILWQGIKNFFDLLILYSILSKLTSWSCLTRHQVLDVTTWTTAVANPRIENIVQL